MSETHPRLSMQVLEQLPQDVLRPTYDRKQLKAGIVHLGIGAFHRAHQAVYTDDILQAGAQEWGIIGVSLRSPDTRDALALQDGLYTITVRSTAHEQVRVIGSVVQLLVAPENPQTVMDALCEPAIKIVSLTITEKGYCYAPATGTLDESHADVVHDLQEHNHPRSALGYIVEALRRRRQVGVAPFTVLSCDNLPSNGETLKRVVTRFAALRDPELAEYIAAHVAFPSTMVDRIVPATTDADRSAIVDATGVVDAWPIMTEAFSQWVVEDHFTSGRPKWEMAGVTFVQDVSAFELMKLRLLNGSHSTIAYLGYLAGHETVSDVMAAEGFERFIRDMMDEEISSTLPKLPDFDLDHYKDQLIERFRNSSLKHRTWQIAMDGSQKLPQRLLGTIRERLAEGLSIDRLSMGVAGWMRYATGLDEKGATIDVSDPLVQEIQARIAGQKTAAELVAAYCSIEEIFPRDLAGNQVFRACVERALQSLLEIGAARSVAQFK